MTEASDPRIVADIQEAPSTSLTGVAATGYANGRALIDEWGPVPAEAPLVMRQWVTIRGGFHEGLRGFLVGARKHVSADYPVYQIEIAGGDSVGGFSLVNIDPEYDDVCPYCGPGQCSGSARIANGADVTAWHRHHPRTRKPRLEPEPAPEP